MDKETKRQIKNLVLTLRESFEADIAVVLGRYGILADKKWERADKLTYLSEDEKLLKDKIEKTIQKEMGSGITPEPQRRRHTYAIPVSPTSTVSSVCVAWKSAG